MLYGPSTVNASVGPDNDPIEVVQTTNYPFDENIHLTIHTAQSVSFPLLLRIPKWCAAPRLMFNGTTVAVSPTPQGFVVLHRTFNHGDSVTLTLPMKVALTQWPQEGVGVEHGPLVYSLPIREKWTTAVERRFTTTEFPSWEAFPASPWNYGLALDPSKLASEAIVKRNTVEPIHFQEPWDNPPISVEVPARRIEGWELQSNPDNAAQKFTPCLPDLNSARVSETLERISLVPYGSTQLRATIFLGLQNRDVSGSIWTAR